MRVFVDRVDEVETLKKLIRSGSRVWITGLRGYGKTTLLRYLVDRFNLDGLHLIYIDCGAIFSPQDLVVWVAKRLEERGLISGEKFELIVAKSEAFTPRDAIESIFEMCANAKVDGLIFDEISTLIQRYSLLKPYRGMGGSMSVAQHLKSLLNRYELSVIFVDTSINSMLDLFEDYTSPLFKEFTYKMELKPLPLTDATILARELLSQKNVKVGNQIARRIALYSNGVPTYIRILTDIINQEISVEEFEEIFFDQLESGILNDYFTTLLDKFPTAEQEVLLIMSRGKTRFSEIEATAINAATALESLTKKGVIYKKFVSKKEVHYWIKDR